MLGTVGGIYSRFNPRTYIRYDLVLSVSNGPVLCFNPRTYIRYDDSILPKWLTYRVSIHVPI